MIFAQFYIKPLALVTATPTAPGEVELVEAQGERGMLELEERSTLSEALEVAAAACRERSYTAYSIFINWGPGRARQMTPILVVGETL